MQIPFMTNGTSNFLKRKLTFSSSWRAELRKLIRPLYNGGVVEERTYEVKANVKQPLLWLRELLTDD